MSTGNIAYLILVGCGFGAFMVTLSYGYIRCNLPERRPRAETPREAPQTFRKAA